jgi:predicted small integral membrane protein
MTWMAWTSPTAIFFVSIAMVLLIMTILELVKPTTMARGFLPMPTTRGDRFFISLLSAAFIHLLWLGILGDYLLVASALAVVWFFVLIRWG